MKSPANNPSPQASLLAPGSRLQAATFFQGPGAGFSRDFGIAAANNQGFKDQAAFGALAGLGTAAQNAMGQYGISRNAALTNQSIAQANAFGQMANNYYNTMGQLGYFGANMTGAGLNAGAQTASGTQNSNVNFDIGGSASFGGGGGGGGFNARGPEGTIARGSMGGGGGFGGSVGGSYGGGGGMSAEVTRGATPEERAGMLDQGYGFLEGLSGTLNDPDNPAMALAGLMNTQFNNNRAATMDPSIMNSLNAQLGAGYGALGDLYGMSDYGFNTGAPGPSGGYRADAGSPDYWLNPTAAGTSLAPRRPGGRYL